MSCKMLCCACGELSATVAKMARHMGAGLADEGTKSKDFTKWTGELVLHCLEEAFRRNPEAAMFSISTISDLPSDGPIEGTHLIQATAFALGFDSPLRIHILHHARSSANGELIRKLCENRSWNPGTHYWWVKKASITVAEWLNARAMQAPVLADSPHAPAKRRGPGRPRILGSKPAAFGVPALSKSSRMMIEIKKMLSQKESVHRKELLDYLLATKIMGNETDPMHALATFLSNHKKDFQSDGSGNFSLRKP
jgi:hypothetical protein